jgi:hypothetical protein
LGKALFGCPRGFYFFDNLDIAMYIVKERSAKKPLKNMISCKVDGLSEPEMDEFDGGLLPAIFKNKYSTEQLTKLGLNMRQIWAVKYASEKEPACEIWAL